MPDRFQYDEGLEGFQGTGTIEQYFRYEKYEIKDASYLEYLNSKSDEEKAERKKFDDYIEKRDRALSRLLIQLFTEYSGLKPEDQIKAFCLESREEQEALVNQGGLVMILCSPDDPIYGLFKDGKPVAAYYASFRGMYQAGGYVAETNKHYYAHNFRESPQDVWLEDGKDIEGHDICSEIAEEFLFPERREARYAAQEN